MTFGQLSAMYSLQAHGIQVKVSRDFSTKRTALSNTDLIDYLHVLTHFRNRCAHIERLFSYKDRYDIPDTALHEKLGIPKIGKQYVCGKHDLFAVVIAYRYLLPKEEFKEFKRELIKLINKTVKKASTLTEEKYSQLWDSRKIGKISAGIGHDLQPVCLLRSVHQREGTCLDYSACPHV